MPPKGHFEINRPLDSIKFINDLGLITFVTSNHQTTNLVFPNFFHEFFSVLVVEEINKLFIAQKKACFLSVMGSTEKNISLW